jgi:hypothetical protein
MKNLFKAALPIVAALSAACTPSSTVSSPASGSGPEMAVAPTLTVNAPSPDPRIGLKGGWMDAQEAIWNLRHVGLTPPSEKFMPSAVGDQRFWQSDLSFMGNYVIQGNFSGFQVWDVSNPAAPSITLAYVCPGSQVDVSVYRHLLFLSHESTTTRLDCGLDPLRDTVSKDRARGIRIFDVSDMRNPKMLAVVQTCRGSHTHTVVDDPKDRNNIYIYVSGSAGVRSPNELAGCSNALPDSNPNSSRFRIEVIQVPLAHPEQAHIINSPRIFQGLEAPPTNTARDTIGRGGRGAGGRGGPPPATAAANNAAAAGAGRGRAPVVRRGPEQCHDITVYPAIGLAGGACGGYGLLLDIRDPKNPRRIGAAADSNFSFWHSATFNNDGTKVLFTDEWGGGTAPRCRDTDKPEWGADAIFTLDAQRNMHFKSYYKLPVVQTALENCVAHDGSLVPIPGRDVMAQGWYQGGISIFDWTDPSHPVEIAFHDRGPIDTTKLAVAGSWSAYWYNGKIYSSEIARGLDIFDLTPTKFLTQNEIDAAKSVHVDLLNAQNQQRIAWPANFAVTRAYLDQAQRSGAVGLAESTILWHELDNAENVKGAARRTALRQMAARLRKDLRTSKDPARIRALTTAITNLSNVK